MLFEVPKLLEEALSQTDGEEVGGFWSISPLLPQMENMNEVELPCEIYM